MVQNGVRFMKYSPLVGTLCNRDLRNGGFELPCSSGLSDAIWDVQSCREEFCLGYKVGVFLFCFLFGGGEGMG